jgi:hypothetical protein
MKRKFTLLATLLAVPGITAPAALAATKPAPASTPAVVTEPATSIGENSAILRGRVDPRGSSTIYEFQWGLTTAYGLATTKHSAGKGKAYVAVAAKVSGLIPGTVYHYRVIAVNKGGQTIGADRALKTAGNPPPDVATGPATQLTATSATVTGTINPNKETTHYAFQWGTSTTYSATTLSVGSTKGGPQTVTTTISPLPSGTLIHYRLVAYHSDGLVVSGGDQTLWTYPSPRPVPVLTSKSSPKHESGGPFLFTTTGSVQSANPWPAALQCNGSVIVHYLWRNRQVFWDLVPVKPDCTYSEIAVLPHKYGSRRARRHTQRIRVITDFAGNGYLAPASAPRHPVFIG